MAGDSEFKPKSKPGSTDESEAVRRRVPDGSRNAFDTLLRRAVPDEASPPEGETSDQA